jgi:hypothetical protein
MPTDPSQLELTSEENFVLARIDGRLSLEDLGDLTGIQPGQMESIVDSLAEKGAVEIPGATPVRARRKSWRPMVAAMGAPATMQDVSDLGDEGEDAAWARGFEKEWPTGEEPVARGIEEGEREAAGGSEAEGASEAAGGGEEDVTLERDVDPVDDEDDGDATPAEDEEVRSQRAAEIEEDRAAGVLEPQNYRKMFEMKFRPLEPQTRAHLALTASSQDLFALAFDPEPTVIAALLANGLVGFAQARFVATWHGTSAGLDLLAKKPQFLQDGGIQRRLVRNTHTSEALLRRVLQPKRMVEIFGAAMDRDVPQLSRTRARGILRAKFTRMAQPDERVELIVKTEGRCLALLVGCTFDGRTTQALASRQYGSVVFIRNLARFPATPPTILAHLAKQPMVRRNPAIRKMIMQHKNTPPEAKKNL